MSKHSLLKNLLIIIVVVVVGYVAYTLARGVADNAVEEQVEVVDGDPVEDSGESNGTDNENVEDEETETEPPEGIIEPEIGFEVQGQVVRGPMCAGPEREDEPCPDEGFLTEIDILDVDTEILIGTISTTGRGEFTTILPNGTYEFSPQGNVFPRCETLMVTVPSVSATDLLITCDTGIR